MIINQGNLTTLRTAFNAAFNDGFRSVTPQWGQVATMVPSTTSEEEYGWLGQWPDLREWLGDRVVKSLQAHHYAIRNKDFESTVGVPRNAIKDDKYGVYSPMMKELGFAAATHPDKLIFALLAAGFATACYDGQYFFDTDHSVGAEGAVASVSNMQAGGGNPWFLLDTRRSLKPLIYQKREEYQFVSLDSPTDENVFMRKEFIYGVDGRCNVGLGFWQMAFGSKATLDETNFNAALDAMTAFKSDEGRPLGIMPNLLVVGSSNRSKALKVVKASTIVEGGAAVDNINKDAVDILVCPWLA